MEDHELIQQILNGKPFAAEKLHSRYVDCIFNYIYLQTNNYHDAEELLQDVFFKTARQLHRFEGKSSFKTWIFKIARNIVIDYYRKNKNPKKPISVEDSIIESKMEEQESVENTVLRRLHMDEVLQTLSKLPEHYQTVLHLRFIEEFSIRETAEIMGKTILSIKAIQHRARKELSEHIKMEASSL